MQSVFTIIQKEKNVPLKQREHGELFILREAIERMVYGSKTLMDAKSTIDDLRAAHMPLINEYLGEFRRKMISLYTLMAACLAHTETSEQKKHLKKFFQEIVNTDEDFLSSIGDSLPQEILSNRQLSSLIHVSQALHRSHKAMLHTFALLFPEKLA